MRHFSYQLSLTDSMYDKLKQLQVIKIGIKPTEEYLESLFNHFLVKMMSDAKKDITDFSTIQNNRIILVEELND